MPHRPMLPWRLTPDQMIDVPTGWLLLILALALAALVFLVRRRWERRRWLESRIAELEALGKAGRALVEAQLDPTALYQLIFEQASTIIDTSIFQLGLFENNQYRIVLWVRDGVRQQPADFDIRIGEGLVGWVAQNRSPLLIHDFVTEWDSLPAHPRYYQQGSPRAAVFIPLITGDECIGTIAAQSHAPGAFTKDDVRRLSIMANQAASAIANAWLYQQTQTRAAQLELVSRISGQVRALTPLPDLFDQTVHLIKDTFGYYCVTIFSYCPNTSEVNLQASTLEEADQWAAQLADGRGLVNWAVTNVETVVVNDAQTDKRFLRLSALPDTRSEIVVPLIIEQQVMGVLDVQSDRLNAFGVGDQFALQALTDQIALAIQESRLYHAERQQRSVAETLREVAHTISSSLELATVLDAILTDLRRVLTYDAAAILLLESGDMVVVQAAQGVPGVAQIKGQRFSLKDSERLKRLAEGDRPIIFECEEGTGCFHAMLDFPKDHACLGTPLISREELIGFLTVDALPPYTYRAEDAAVIAAFAGQAAVAIDNARLFDSQREEAWVSGALLQMAEATAQSTDLDQVIETITHMTMTLVGVERCGILLWNQERESFRGTQVAGSSTDLSDEFSRLCLSTEIWPPLATLVQRPHPTFISGGEALSALPDELFDFFGIDAWLLLLPLIGKGELIGAMLVSGDIPNIELIRNRVHLIGGIANQAAMAINSAQLYAAQQEESFVNIALLQVSETVNSLADLSDILSTIVRLTPILVGVERCLFLYWNADQGDFSMGPDYGLKRDQIALLQQSLGEPEVTAFLRQLEPVEPGSVAEPIGIGNGYPNQLPPAWQDVFGNSEVFALSLNTRREMVGAMLVSLPAEGEPFGARRRNILSGIAHQASLAIENDQLYAEAAERQRMERELEVAREIQTSFLPDSQPEAPGWSVGTFWQAARQVAGDFYDFFPLTRGEHGDRWGVVIADVADKGVPAALYMALSRTLIRTIGLNRVDPATSLGLVNDILIKDSRSDLFVTVVYAVWEPELNRFTYSNAGHNPPIFLRADGTVDVLRDNNIVLGVLPAVSLSSRQVFLEPGEVLVLYTDGITDAINDKVDEFGLDRLTAVSSANRRQPAFEIVQAIEQAVAQFTGKAPQFDDLTLVVLKREE